MGSAISVTPRWNWGASTGVEWPEDIVSPQNPSCHIVIGRTWFPVKDGRQYTCPDTSLIARLRVRCEQTVCLLHPHSRTSSRTAQANSVVVATFAPKSMGIFSTASSLPLLANSSPPVRKHCTSYKQEQNRDETRVGKSNLSASTGVRRRKFRTAPTDSACPASAERSLDCTSLPLPASAHTRTHTRVNVERVAGSANSHSCSALDACACKKGHAGEMGICFGIFGSEKRREKTPDSVIVFEPPEKPVRISYSEGSQIWGLCLSPSFDTHDDFGLLLSLVSPPPLSSPRLENLSNLLESSWRRISNTPDGKPRRAPIINQATTRSITLANAAYRHHAQP